MKLLFLLWIFSPFGIWSLVRKQQKPCDESNRFNKLILIWFAFTRYEDIIILPRIKISGGIEISFETVTRFELVWFATTSEKSFAYHFPWLKTDMWERLNDNN